MSIYLHLFYHELYSITELVTIKYDSHRTEKKAIIA